MLVILNSWILTAEFNVQLLSSPNSTINCELLMTEKFIPTRNSFILTYTNVWIEVGDWAGWQSVSQTSNCFDLTVSSIEINRHLVNRFHDAACLIVRYPRFNKKLWVIDDREVYFYPKQFYFDLHQRLNRSRWLNRVTECFTNVKLFWFNCFFHRNR